MRKYKSITYPDRLEIERLCRENKSVIEMSNIIGVHRQTMYRELARGGAKNEKLWLYSADVAQKTL